MDPAGATIDKPLIELGLSSIHFETVWPLNSQEQSNGMRYYVRLETEHELDLPQPTELGQRNMSRKDYFQPGRISQSSNESLDHVHPSLGLHALLKNSLEEYSDSTDFQNQLFSICLMAFHFAEVHPYCNPLNKIFVQVSGQSTRRPKTFAVACLTRAEYEQIKANDLTGYMLPAHRAYIGLGSNLGNCVENIEFACQEMSNHGIMVTKTSFLYKTKPMYLENQQPFVNGICEVY